MSPFAVFFVRVLQSLDPSFAIVAGGLSSPFVEPFAFSLLPFPLILKVSWVGDVVVLAVLIVRAASADNLTVCGDKYLHVTID